MSNRIIQPIRNPEIKLTTEDDLAQLDSDARHRSTMKVLVFSLAPLWSPHFETDLEIIARHRDAGDKVVVVGCDGGLRSCIANPYHRRIDCAACRSKCQNGLRAVGVEAGRVDKIPQWPIPVFHTPVEFPFFDDVEDLRAYEYRGLPIGRGAASSLVSILRESNPDMVVHRELVVRQLESALQVAESTKDAIRLHEPDLVYVFNGRFATTAPVLAVCERNGINYRTHDAGYTWGRYRVINAGTVHNLSVIKREINTLWESAAERDLAREEKARSFFELRQSGNLEEGRGHTHFATFMDPGRLPRRSDEDFILILNSSEDEFSALDEYSNPLYTDQLDALDQVTGDARLQKEKFILRVHPNLIGLDNEQTRHLARLSHRPNLTIVPAYERVDTYALIRRSKAVVTFGSTTGIEAVYWGRPSILIGRAPFEELGLARPKSHAEVVDMIIHPPDPPSAEMALPYGYFMVEAGEPFMSFDQVSYHEGSFLGQPIRPAWPIRQLRRARNAMRMLRDQTSRPRKTDNRHISQR